MSQTATLNYLETALEAISSTPSGTVPCRQGIGEAGLPTEIGQYPLFVLSVVDQEPEVLTAGAGGTVHEHYAVIITLYLGPEGMAHDVAMSRAKLFPSRMRAKLTPDWKLGGNVWNSDLRGPANNLRIDVGSGLPQYKVQNTKPIQQWALMVTENTTANAAAL